MGKKVRMAFVGLGWWGNVLADIAKANEKIKIAACCSRSENKMKDFVSTFGGAAVSDYGTLVSSPDIDAVILTTPNSLHARQAIEAAENGKHIFVEKPMALTTADCTCMIEAAAKAGVVLTVGHNSRRMERFRKAKLLIEEGAVGRIVLVEVNSSNDLGMSIAPDHWRSFRSENPGGPLMTISVHQADNLNHLIGPVKKVSAFINKICGPAEADDVVSSVLEFENGALGYLGGSYITPRRQLFQVHGTEGVIFIDEEGGSGSIYYQKRGTKTMVKQAVAYDAKQQKKESLKEELDDFANSILTGVDLEITGETGRAAIALMEAMVISARMDKTVLIKNLLQS